MRALDRSPSSVDPAIHQSVTEILAAVRAKGDSAVLELTERFDHVSLRADELRVTPDELDAAERALGDATVTSLRYAAQRIARFHEACAPRSWSMTDDNGSLLGQEVRPLARVAVYVPGGPPPPSRPHEVVPRGWRAYGDVLLSPPPPTSRSMPPVVAARIAG